MALFGAVFIVVSFTDLHTEPLLKRKEKDKSSIDQNAIDLWGIAAIDYTFICGGGSFFLSSHSTICACQHWTFSPALCLK
jgi:hypothetical protein